MIEDSEERLSEAQVDELLDLIKLHLIGIDTNQEDVIGIDNAAAAEAGDDAADEEMERT